MKILFLTDNFPPEYNAPATRTFEHCKEWVKLGAEVTVITCVPNFPRGEVFAGYRNRWRQEEQMDGIKVIRVWSFISSNQGTFKRTVDFLSFAFTSIVAGIWVKTDIILATSPQFFTAIAGCVLSIVKRKPWIMEVRDIWPESIQAVDAVKTKWIISLLEKLELFLYRHARKVLVVTDSFKRNITGRGIDHNKIFVIKNGVDISRYKPLPKNQDIVQALSLHNKFVIGYIGTHGLAHSLGFVIQSIEKLTDESIHFLFIGDGAEKRNVVSLAERLKLNNITFIDPVSKEQVKEYLSVLDVALVPLRKSPTFQSVIPSKVFEAVAMHIPILLGVDGETREIVESYNVGLYFEPENEIDFIDKVTSIKDRITKSKDYFLEGCQKMAKDFNRKTLAKEMLNIIAQK